MAELHIIPWLEHLLCSIDISKNTAAATSKQHQNVKTIVVLDISSSMGSQVPRIIQRILPIVLRQSGCSDSEPIDLLLFNQSCTTIRKTVNQLVQFEIFATGGTQISSALDCMQQHFAALFQPNQATRILVISDGENSYNNQKRMLDMANAMQQEFSKRNIQPIIVHALRWQSSGSASPDTQALASVLLWNTKHNQDQANQLHDIDAIRLSDALVINQLDQILAKDACSAPLCTLTAGITSRVNCFFPSPWNEGVDKVNLNVGSNVFWLSSQTDVDSLIFETGQQQSIGASQDIKVVRHPECKSMSRVRELLGKKLDQLLSQMRFLKVIGKPVGHSGTGSSHQLLYASRKLHECQGNRNG